VSSTAWGAQKVEELLYSPTLRTVFSAGNGEVEIYELAVSEAWRGKRLEELLAGAECVAVAYTRAGRSALPSPDTVLAGGDVVHVSASLTGVEDLRRRLDEKKGA
jgi:trk system potassium uptake protein TrkA